MMNFKKCILLVLGQFIFMMNISGQELPPINNYKISDYKAGNQNWAISQAANNFIYVGNNDGLLEFDGARWTLYPSQNGTIFRAVTVIGDLIYTGCYMEFGYWKRNTFGSLEYTSLLDKLEEPLVEDEHFWNIIGHDKWVLFQSVNRIYLYDTENESFKIIDFDVQRAKIFNLEGEIFVQKNTGGLYRIQNGKAVLETENPIIKNSFIVGFYFHEGRKIIITENGKFYFYEEGNLKEWETDLKDGEELYIYSALQLSDGSYVLGTISNGFIQLDRSGKIIQCINQESGLLNNTVLSLFEDAENNLWIGLDNGISNINLESAFKIYKDSKGQLGVVYASLVFDDFLYLGTNQGLYYKRLNSNTDFKLVEGTKGQVWNLNLIDDTIFCSHTKGTLIISGQKAQLIYNETGTWSVTPVKEGELLIQGNYNGLSILKKSGGKWKFRNKIEGFDTSSRAISIMDQDNQIIVNHEFKGLFRLVVDKDYRKVQKTDFLERMGYSSSILKYNDEILYTSSEGVFNLDLNAFQLSKNEAWNEVFYSKGNEIWGKLVFESKGEKVWGFSERNVICMSIDSFDGTPKVVQIPVPSFFRRDQGLVGYENVSHLYDSSYLIGTSDGYKIIDLNKPRGADYSVTINAIEKKVRFSFGEALSLNDNLILPFDQSMLKFSFSVPEYDKYKEVEFQYQLKGQFETWSVWFSEPDLTFSNLPHGSYKLLVRARIGNKISKNVATYAFEIEKPWFVSTWAIIAYIIGFFLFIGLIHTSYIRYYRNQRSRLIEENNRQLEHTRLENEQEIMRLKNEQLMLDLESKNRELATTAMTLINKNELLNSLKSDLLQTEAETSKEEIVKMIDKNLVAAKDWEYFKEAFNNADKNFLDKIKNIHPELTANDLKFCAFLRLNLSSKEIAPLLNISVRSVEIKRYRLRKKLGIDHEVNLVDYILEV